MTSTERANWTIAYRKRTANRFLRVSTWAGTWPQAVAMARLFAAANPDLEVHYTSNRAAEVEGFVTEDDVRNILVDSGRRVRIVETDVELPAEMIARIPNAETARERWIDGDAIADAEGADELSVEQVAEYAGSHDFRPNGRDWQGVVDPGRCAYPDCGARAASPVHRDDRGMYMGPQHVAPATIEAARTEALAEDAHRDSLARAGN